MSSCAMPRFDSSRTVLARIRGGQLVRPSAAKYLARVGRSKGRTNGFLEMTTRVLPFSASRRTGDAGVSDRPGAAGGSESAGCGGSYSVRKQSQANHARDAQLSRHIQQVPAIGRILPRGRLPWNVVLLSADIP